jgi:hypothetical protein
MCGILYHGGFPGEVGPIYAYSVFRKGRIALILKGVRIVYLGEEPICFFRDRLQHHILNRIVIFRYRMARLGIPKTVALPFLLLIEYLFIQTGLIASRAK